VTALVALVLWYHRATDSQKIQTWERSALQVSIPYEDVLVLLLEDE